MTKERYSDLGKYIQFIIQAHEGAIRGWDGETPYSIHPLWCSMTIYTETTLPKNIRDDGATILLFHDVIEDTSFSLPEGLSNSVLKGIKDMTFMEGMRQEMVEIWSKEPRIRLYKLYDKISNLLDSLWMSPEVKEIYMNYTSKLLVDVERNYGPLNIVKIAHAILD